MVISLEPAIFFSDVGEQQVEVRFVVTGARLREAK